MWGSHPCRKNLRISPLEIPTVFPPRDVRDGLSPPALSSLPLCVVGGTSGPRSRIDTFHLTASGLCRICPRTFESRLVPRTDSMASKPSEERRNLYPCARKEIDASCSKTRKGMEARSRACASNSEHRPAPEMRIGLRVLLAMVVMAGSRQTQRPFNDRVGCVYWRARSSPGLETKLILLICERTSTCLEEVWVISICKGF